MRPSKLRVPQVGTDGYEEGRDVEYETFMLESDFSVHIQYINHRATNSGSSRNICMHNPLYLEQLPTRLDLHKPAQNSAVGCDNKGFDGSITYKIGLMPNQ